jgi:hypothetical protein
MLAVRRGRKPAPITCRGVSLTVEQWSAALGKRPGTIWQALKRGDSVDVVLALPEPKIIKVFEPAPVPADPVAPPAYRDLANRAREEEVADMLATRNQPGNPATEEDRMRACWNAGFNYADRCRK